MSDDAKPTQPTSSSEPPVSTPVRTSTNEATSDPHDDRGPAPEEQAAGGEIAPVPEPAAPEVIGTRVGMFGVKGTGDTSGYGRLVRHIVLPGSSARPYGGYFDDVADQLERVLPDYEQKVAKVVVHRGELTLEVRREHLLETMQLLRDDPALRFEMCLGCSGVHFPEDSGRELHVVYPLLSLTHRRRIRVEVVAPDADPHIPSITSVHPGNNWHERETFDFFGVIFDGHPSLTRIEMPDDWPGHPQRKDYPLGGINVEYKGAHVPAPEHRRSYQ